MNYRLCRMHKYLDEDDLGFALDWFIEPSGPNIKGEYYRTDRFPTLNEVIEVFESPEGLSDNNPDVNTESVDPKEYEIIVEFTDIEELKELKPELFI